MVMAITVQETSEFSKWLYKLRDRQAAAMIVSRLSRIELGNFGDHKSLGDKVSEMRLDFGPGYRVYFTKRGETVVILLCGGDKGSQEKDIEKAKAMAKELAKS